MKKLGVLALTLGLMLIAAAPSQATVKLSPETVPMAAAQGGSAVIAPVAFTISADEVNRNMVSWSVSGSTGPYSVTKDCPDVFPDDAEVTCTISVTMNPKAPGVTSGLFPATLKTVLANGVKTVQVSEATALINGVITPAPPAPPKPKPTKEKGPSLKDRIREAREKEEPRPSGKPGKSGKKKCGRKKGKGKAKNKAASSAKKKGKKKCGRKKGKGQKK
jgi:hypothetical protein